MRAIFGLAGVLVVMAIIAALMKQNLHGTGADPSAANSTSVTVPSIDTSGNVHTQSKQIQQQVRDELNNALQQDDQRLKDADQ
ncbi:hypothetical protein WH367_19120 [Comamonas sp. MYb21]|uniref:hypothetical protein n=1 Tax=Comamonas sp. MYb21 TaxID=1848648 RepID=UPI0030B08977